MYVHLAMEQPLVPFAGEVDNKEKSKEVWV